MSMGITNIQGYNEVEYQNLLTEYTERTNKSGIDLQNELLAYAADGKSFDEAVALIRADLPDLPAPIMERDITSYAAGALPSFGSNYMALITELSAEQRKQSADQKALQTEMLISNIEEQADNIRTKAALELTASVISGSMQIASGVFTTVGVGKGMSGVSDAMYTGQAMTVTTKVQAQAGAFTGAGTIASGAFTFGASMVEAESKELEAEAERIRATQDLLDKQDQALHELIQKSISTQDTIQQNINQTRTKILG